MAVIQYSALVTQLRGKLGGSQFNKGHAGYTLQRKSTPTIRQTAAQLAQRQRVSTVQRSWKTETDLRKMQAAQAAQSNPVTDRFGQQVILSGYNHYVKMMTWRLFVQPGGSLNPISDEIITTPVAQSTSIIVSAEMTLQGYDNQGRPVFSGEIQRTRDGIPTGTTNQSRVFYYMRRVDEYGRILPNSREFFLFRLSHVNATTTFSDRWVYTSLPIESGQYYRLEARTINLGAGAITGRDFVTLQLG